MRSGFVVVVVVVVGGVVSWYRDELGHVCVSSVWFAGRLTRAVVGLPAGGRRVRLLLDC